MQLPEPVGVLFFGKGVHSRADSIHVSAKTKRLLQIFESSPFESEEREEQIETPQNITILHLKMTDLPGNYSCLPTLDLFICSYKGKLTFFFFINCLESRVTRCPCLPRRALV